MSNELTSNPVNPGPLMSPVNPAQHQGGLGESISYALHCRAPISNELTSNPVNPRTLGESARRVPAKAFENS